MPGKRDIKLIVKAEVAKAIKNLDKAEKEVNDLHKSAKKGIPSFRGLGAAIGGAISLMAIKRTAELALELSNLGDQADQAELPFKKLLKVAGVDFTEGLENLRKAVRGTASDMELMQTAGMAMDAFTASGMSATAAFKATQETMDFLFRYSTKFGKDFNKLMKTVFTGLQRGSALFLDDVGIMINQTDEQFSGLNSVEKKAKLVEVALGQMATKNKLLGEVTEGTTVEQNKMRAEFENLKVELGRGLHPILLDIIKDLSDLTKAAKESGDLDLAIKNITATVEKLWKAFKFLGSAVGVMQDVGGVLQYIMPYGLAVNSMFKDGEKTVQDYTNEIKELIKAKKEQREIDEYVLTTANNGTAAIQYQVAALQEMVPMITELKEKLLPVDKKSADLTKEYTEQVVREIQDKYRTLGNVLAGPLENFGTALISSFGRDTQTVSEIFNSFLDDMLASIARFLSNQLISAFLNMIINSVMPGIGGIFGGIFSTATGGSGSVFSGPGLTKGLGLSAPSAPGLSVPSGGGSSISSLSPSGDESNLETGGTTVNLIVQGNLIGQKEYVRDQLIPEIQDAVRKGYA